MSDRWLQLAELSKLFGLSEESIKRLAKSHRFPLRRLTPHGSALAVQNCQLLSIL
jgi:predicted DNA-binding transcriptional regulator AlpA